MRNRPRVAARVQQGMVEPLESRTLLSFGLTTTAHAFTVDTGANLVFSVARDTSAGGSIGDLTSTAFNGTQLEAPFSSTDRYSHYESGLSSATVVTATVDPNGQWICITCDDSSSTGTGVIQYYMAQKGDNDIYMATYDANAAAPSPGEMRFIMYLNWGIFTNHPAYSDNSGATGPIESTDVYGYANGTTTSKYYGENEAITTPYYGATGTSGSNAFGAFMFIGNRETSSGGPFYKDIDFQGTGQAEELYNYMFSGHSQTENYRPGLKGPYALQFTNGSQPSTPNYSFISQIGIDGYVGTSGRGTLTGVASGTAAGMTPTVALANATAQYWGTPDSSGNYTISGILPGTYTETLYQNQLAVGTNTVTITAGATTHANIVSTLYTPTEIWAIGSFDGTPNEFLNANLIQDMHPSDVRMSPWANTSGVDTFTVGTSAVDTFPMAEWKEFNTTSDPNDTTIDINFNLTAAQAATPLSLRIGLTRSGDGGRNGVTINGTNAGYPAAPTEPTSRGITTGNWQGDYYLETYNFSTSSLKAGTNTLVISVVSGSSDTDAWLGPWVTFDALDLVTTSSLTNAPVVKSVTVTPANPNLDRNTEDQFTATAIDQFGVATPANFTWSTTADSIDGTGLLTTTSTLGSGTVTATTGSVSGSTNFTVVNTPPTVATPASASPNPVTGTSTNLSVLGADDTGEAGLTYTWATTGTPPAPVGFSANGSNTAKNTTVTFTKAGTYNFQVTITDPDGVSTTSSTSVTVNQTASSIAISPTNPTIAASGSQQFAATVSDQFGNALATQPSIVWSLVSGGGSVSSTGLYNAPASATTATVKAADGNLATTTTVTVLPAAPVVTSIVVNNGAAQRSMVSEVTVNFSSPVSLSPGAITLYQRSSTAGGTPTAMAFTLTPTPSSTTFATSYTLTFTGIGKSLPDGIYDLTVVAADVHDASNQTPASNSTLTFHRLFGDFDGNGIVNGLDYAAFVKAYGASSSSPDYNPIFDYDGNGIINGLDYAQFSLRYGKSYTY